VYIETMIPQTAITSFAKRILGTPKLHLEPSKSYGERRDVVSCRHGDYEYGYEEYPTYTVEAK
jgi:hypothetical protein